MLTIDDKGNRRLLFPDGTTIVSEWDKAREILRGEVLGTKCFAGYETDRYLEVYRKDLAVDPDDIIEPIYDDHNHTEEELNRLLSILSKSDRWKGDDDQERIIQEMEYFIASKNVRFLLKTHDLVMSLKKETVVGVGRGSSCASYVMYLLHIHDIDSLKYGIDFIELSKIGEEEYNGQ